MASPSVLAPASAPRVDVESLLWEVRDLLRGMGQVNMSQSTELARLGSSLDLSISAEYHERAELALKSIDVTLDHLALAASAASDHQFNAIDNASESVFDDAHVVAWLHEMNSSSASSVVAVASPASAVEPSSDFWTTHEFNWDEEPEELEAQPASPSSMPGFVDPDPAVLDDWEDDDEVTPWDSVSERDAASSFGDEEQATHGSSGDDSATLFQSDNDDDKLNRPRLNSSLSFDKSHQRTRDQAYAPVEYAILRQPPLLHHSAAIEGF